VKGRGAFGGRNGLKKSILGIGSRGRIVVVVVDDFGCSSRSSAEAEFISGINIIIRQKLLASVAPYVPVPLPLYVSSLMIRTLLNPFQFLSKPLGFPRLNVYAVSYTQISFVST
jgi:hypothetical protein